MIDRWLQCVESASLRGGIALAVVWVLCWIPRVPAAVRCWMWRAAYLLLIVSFFWTSPVEVPVRAAEKVTPRVVDTGGVPPVGPARSGSVIGADAGVESGPAIPRVAMHHVVESKPVWPAAAFGAWVVFLLIFAGRLLVGWIGANRLRRGDLVTIAELPGICRAMGIRRPPVVRTHPAARGPLLIGLWRPTIVLPPGAGRSPGIGAILAHELAHMGRRDLLWNWLPAIAAALLPVHPMVWIGNRRWRLATESACDAAAIGATAVAPADYGRVLVNVASSRQPRVPGVLAVAVVSNSRWLLTRRLAAMTNLITWNRRRSVTAAIVLGITTAIAVVPWRVVAQQPAETRPAAQAATGPSQFYKVTVERDGKSMTVSVPDGGTLTLESHKPGEGPTTKPVPVNHAMSQRFSQQSGRITAATVDLIARTTGTLKEVDFQEGQLVKAGDLIFKIDDAAEQTKLTYAEADLSEKKVLLDRKKEMASKGAATGSEVQQSEFELRVSASRVELEKIGLGFTRVTAPFDGVLLANDLQVGMTTTSGQKLATMVQTGQMKVTLSLAGSSCLGLKTGMMMDVSGSGQHLPAVVTYISPDIDSAGLRTIRGRLTGDTQNLIVGSNCEVTLPETK